MASIPETVRSALEAGKLAHLVTVGKDGTPQVSCVWVGVDGDDVVTAHLDNHQKLKNVRRDPHVALSLETGRTDEWGMAEYLVVYGQARVVEGGAPELLQRLARTYLGPDVDFPAMDNPPAGYVLHISPDRFSGMGPWA